MYPPKTPCFILGTARVVSVSSVVGPFWHHCYTVTVVPPSELMRLILANNFDVDSVEE